MVFDAGDTVKLLVLLSGALIGRAYAESLPTLARPSHHVSVIRGSSGSGYGVNKERQTNPKNTSFRDECVKLIENSPRKGESPPKKQQIVEKCIQELTAERGKKPSEG